MFNESTIPSPLLWMEVMNKTDMEFMLRSDGLNPNNEVQLKADCEGQYGVCETEQVQIDLCAGESELNVQLFAEPDG